jgi:hypothetical protein
LSRGQTDQVLRLSGAFRNCSGHAWKVLHYGVLVGQEMLERELN